MMNEQRNTLDSRKLLSGQDHLMSPTEVICRACAATDAQRGKIRSSR